MYRKIGEHHSKTLIHIKYNEYEMSITLEGKMLNGKLPNKENM